MASEDSPAFQWYSSDYLADAKVQLATTVQEGIYIRLLSYCWREMTIPADPNRARLLCKADATIDDIAFVLKTFFIPSKDEGLLQHKRLEEERKKQKKNRRQRSDAGRKSGESRRLKAEQKTNEIPNGRSNSVGTKTNSSTSSSTSSSSSVSEEKTVTDGPGPSEPGEAAEEPVLIFPVIGKPFQWPLVPSKIREFQETFPALDILGQCKLALQWCKENRSKQKTAGGMGRFLLSWLSRAQNDGRGGSGQGTGGGPKVNPTNDPRGNFAAREAYLQRRGAEHEGE